MLVGWIGPVDEGSVTIGSREGLVVGGGKSGEGELRANEAIEVGALGRCGDETLVDGQWYSEITVNGPTSELDQQQLMGLVISDAGQHRGFDRGRDHRRPPVQGPL